MRCRKCGSPFSDKQVLRLHQILRIVHLRDDRRFTFGEIAADVGMSTCYVRTLYLEGKDALAAANSTSGGSASRTVRGI